MKLPVVKVIFDRKKTSGPLSEGKIEIRITHQRKTKYVSTGISILPIHWDPVKYIKPTCPRYQAYSSTLVSQLNHIDSVTALLTSRGEEATVEKIWAHLEVQKYNGSFIDFAKEMIEDRTDICYGTRRNHRKLVSRLKEFKRIYSFSDLTPSAVRAFDQWLHKQEIRQTTIHSYHKFLKVYINMALERELLDRNPYLGMRLSAGTPAKRKFLSPEEFQRLSTSDIPDALQNVRDLFLFQCYTGLAYVDMSHFRKEHVTERNGRYILTAKRVKSGEDYYIVLIDKAVKLLKKYDWVLPMMTLEQYNMRLKMLAIAVDVRRDLTSHMARHTFAVKAINTGIPIKVVGTMLGHSNTRTTEIYAKIINRTVEDAFDLLENVV